ncbi:hypothetical protein XELAEV_18041913mg [Xenopus laevis]|uniref:Uncharacterized protein n=1 Tax=Xenopus laevis TaxID=8355 RepID=A0A974C338_XENLA|nr:hypothetical protein XELAEV_18041913mg [Xenopus laevis]
MTFAYSDLDKSRITEAVGGSTDFLNVKDCKQNFRELENSQRKSVAYDVHLRTLSEYVRINRIPRGLRVHLRPTLFAEDKDFCQRWEAIINKCSLDLMLATMERLQKELPAIQQQIVSQELEMRNSFPPEIVAEGTEKLADHVKKFRSEVEARKRSKFQRDAGDYSTGNVYRWNRPSHDGMGGNKRSLGTRGGHKAHPPRGYSPTRPRSDSNSTTSSFLSGSQATDATSEEEGAQGENTEKKRGRQGTYRRRR